jgi:protein TonB
MQIVRTGVAALLALGITFGLFFLMQFLISMGENRGASVTKGPVIEFVRLKRETYTKTRDRELPEKEKPPEQPPPPELEMSPSDAPDADAMAFAAPSVDVKPDMGGGLDIGAGASDSDSIPIVTVPPQFPLRAAERGIEGWVYFEFTITAAGTVKDPVVIDSDPPRIFDRAGMRAIRKWKFRPKVVDGKAVESKGRYRIKFELEKS